jgi:hypothetical protein
MIFTSTRWSVQIEPVVSRSGEHEVLYRLIVRKFCFWIFCTIKIQIQSETFAEAIQYANAAIQEFKHVPSQSISTTIRNIG